MKKRVLAGLALAFAVGLAAPSVATATEKEKISPPDSLDSIVADVFTIDTEVRRSALKRLVERGQTDVVAPLIDALFFVGDAEDIGDALKKLTKADVIANWHQWMLWQEDRPAIAPYAGYDAFKADLMALIDPNFRLFLKAGVARDIRIEEIAWGGVVKDGIPALTNPKLIPAAEAKYLWPNELVFGVSIGGDARAYPFRIMDWHEMFNDVIGGVPVALAYCTLCGSGILFDARVAGRDKPFVFGSSGFLYRSNKLMYDQETHSLWNQFTGRPVVGPLVGSGIELKTLPVAIATWADWLARHPETKVLSLETGFERDYTPGKPYDSYFRSPNLMFPAQAPDPRLKPKDFVFALRLPGNEKAWPLARFEGGAVVNDDASGLAVVLVGDAAMRSVRAYKSEGRAFRAGANPREIVAADGVWRVEEEALVAADGRKLERLPGHIAYWFAWSNFRRGKPFGG
jgi:hypothetical protein